jgi:hypothetical protein
MTSSSLVNPQSSTKRLIVPLEPLSRGLLTKAGDFDEQFRLPMSFPAMPPGAVEVTNAYFKFRPGKTESNDHFRLRLFSSTGFHEFDFRLQVSLGSEPKSENTTNESG